MLEERTSGNESYLHMLAELPASLTLEVEACQLAKKLLLDLEWAPKETRVAILAEKGGPSGLTPFMKARALTLILTLTLTLTLSQFTHEGPQGESPRGRDRLPPHRHGPHPCPGCGRHGGCGQHAMAEEVRWRSQSASVRRQACFGGGGRVC